MIDIKNFDPNKINIDGKSYKSILTYYNNYETTNSVKPLYLTINKINGYIEENNEHKYLTQVLLIKAKIDRKKYEELWSKIRDLIRSTSINSDDYDKRYMKIKFNSTDNIPLNKTLELHKMIIVRSVFDESKKYYPYVF